MHAIVSAVSQAWPPFVLVAGLLLIGAAAAADGLFEAAGARLARSSLGGRGLLVALLGLVAAVTAVLNLDTSVVFLTPVLVHTARRRGLDERPFLYGSVFMANAASLLLPGSNLTNLLVLRTDPEAGTTFAADMLPAWLVACAITAAFVTVAFRRGEAGPPAPTLALPLRLRFGAAAAGAAALLVVALRNPAIPVLVIGVAAVALQRLRPRLDVRVLMLLFAVAVGLGTIARLWNGPTRLVASSGTWAAAGIGAAASLVLNNLPATVLLAAQPPAHPEALLLGLDLGPNLAVTGSLSAVLWLQTARALGARPSIATYTRLGVLLVPLTLAATIAVLIASGTKARAELQLPDSDLTHRAVTARVDHAEVEEAFVVEPYSSLIRARPGGHSREDLPRRPHVCTLDLDGSRLTRSQPAMDREERAEREDVGKRDGAGLQCTRPARKTGKREVERGNQGLAARELAEHQRHDERRDDGQQRTVHRPNTNARTEQSRLTSRVGRTNRRGPVRRRRPRGTARTVERAPLLVRPLRPVTIPPPHARYFS